MITLDTNILVHFFRNDDTVKAKKVTDMLKGDDFCLVPDVVFIELEYVLCKKYATTKDQLTAIYNFLIGHPLMVITTEIKIANEIYQSYSIDMADCIIAAYSLKGKLASFDKKLLKVEGVNSYWH